MQYSLMSRAAIWLLLLGLGLFPASLRAEEILVDPLSDTTHWALTGEPPVWRDADGLLTLQTPTNVIALAGQHDPIFQQGEETSRPTTVSNSAGLQVAGGGSQLRPVFGTGEGRALFLGKL